jgi:putative transposase
VPESSKAFVWEAFQRVKANGGSVGVDGESIEEFGTESSFSSLKRERSRKHIYKNRDPATKDVADKSENFLNRVRRRSHVGGVSPEQFASAQKSR